MHVPQPCFKVHTEICFRAWAQFYYRPNILNKKSIMTWTTEPHLSVSSGSTQKKHSQQEMQQKCPKKQILFTGTYCMYFAMYFQALDANHPSLQFLNTRFCCGARRSAKVRSQSLLFGDNPFLVPVELIKENSVVEGFLVVLCKNSLLAIFPKISPQWIELKWMGIEWGIGVLG